MECVLFLYLVQHVISTCKDHSFLGYDAIWCSR